MLDDEIGRSKLVVEFDLIKLNQSCSQHHSLRTSSRDQIRGRKVGKRCIQSCLDGTKDHL